MHLIENHSFDMLVQKSDRIILGKIPHVEVF